MDSYEKKYKEAKDKVAARFGINVAKEIFTDLYESEDVRIRKEIMDFIDTNTIESDERRNRWFSWLEKQGEKDRFIKEEIECIKGYRENAIKKLEELEKQGDKPAWSEEDEVRLQACLDTLQVESLMGKVDTQITMWLKSLKERIGG